LQEDGQRFNPIVHAGAIQDAFAAADSEERHLCAAISKWSKVLAEDGRFLSRATSTAEVVAAIVATSTVVSALLLRRSEMIVRPTDQCFALVLKQPEDDTHLTVLPWRQSDMGLLNAAAHPWSTELLQDFRMGVGLFEGRGSQRKNVSIKCLVGLTSPHSTSEVSNFPPKSTEVTCGALCLQSSHPARIRQFMQILNFAFHVRVSVCTEEQACFDFIRGLHSRSGRRWPPRSLL
jgi:hypothetical protein